MSAIDVAGEGELLVVGAGRDASPRLGAELVPALVSRFRVASVGAAAPREIAAALGRLAPERWAAIAVGAAAPTLLEVALDGPAPAPEALVLLGPRGTDAVAARADGLAAWDRPVLILAGEDDPRVPVAAIERLHEAMPAASLGLLPGCGDPVEDALETVGPIVLEYLRARLLHEPHGHVGAGGVVALQLERRPPWADLAAYERDDPEPTRPDPAEQEVGPNA